MLSGFWDLSWNVVKVLCVVLVGYGAFLVVFQRKMIYFPTSYTDQMLQLIENKEEIKYQVSGKPQVAYFVPPRSKPNKPPSCLWIMLGGNASVALGWADLVSRYPDDRTAFLLIDYPGYGKNEGHPSLTHNLQAVDQAYRALLTHLSIPPDSPPFQLGVAAHSLGSAMAVAFAQEHKTDSLLLLSPFTSMKKVVHQHFPVFGNLLGVFLMDQYQVDQPLSKLQNLPQPPKVIIMHGTQDEIVPVMMSRQMAQKYGEFVQYQEIPDADHNFVYGYLPLIIEKMNSLCP